MTAVAGGNAGNTGTMAQIGNTLRALANQQGAPTAAVKAGTAEAAPARAAPSARTAKSGPAYKPAGTHAKAEAPKASKADLKAVAKLRGYEGDACPECGNFTLVRNGTCLKCDTCGGTTGWRLTAAGELKCGKTMNSSRTDTAGSFSVAARHDDSCATDMGSLWN